MIQDLDIRVKLIGDEEMEVVAYMLSIWWIDVMINLAW